MTQIVFLLALCLAAVSATQYGYSQPQTYMAPKQTYVAPAYKDSYESPSYSSNVYVPIYSINSNPRRKGDDNKKGNKKNMNLIRSSYDSGYGVTDGGYGKGTPYYTSNYYTCVQNDNGNNGKGRGKGRRAGLSNLAGLLGGCNNLGNSHQGYSNDNNYGSHGNESY